MSRFRLLLATIFIFLPFAAVAQGAPNCADTLGPVCPSGYQPIPGSCTQHPGTGCKAGCFRTKWAIESCKKSVIDNVGLNLAGENPANGGDINSCEDLPLFKMGECASKCKVRDNCPTSCPAGEELVSSCPSASSNCAASNCGCLNLGTGEWSVKKGCLPEN